jgi:hypothetical protein
VPLEERSAELDVFTGFGTYVSAAGLSYGTWRDNFAAIRLKKRRYEIAKVGTRDAGILGSTFRTLRCHVRRTTQPPPKVFPVSHGPLSQQATLAHHCFPKIHRQLHVRTTARSQIPYWTHLCVLGAAVGKSRASSSWRLMSYV